RPPTSPPEPSEISDIIVFGDSDFLSNSSYNQGGGSDLFLNSANFLVGDYSLVSIRPKVFAFREFNLDANEYDFVRFSSWLFLPGLMGLMATFVWWVRR
ncbi:MAG: ABC transporter, partial [Chloroflexi bacterium]|nr:ABC transporter [Chloroflexota bacterium]